MNSVNSQPAAGGAENVSEPVDPLPISSGEKKPSLPEQSQRKRGEAPPLMLHAPNGLDGVEQLTPAQERTVVIAVSLPFVIALAIVTIVGMIEDSEYCEPDRADPNEVLCTHHDGSSRRLSYSAWKTEGGRAYSYGGFGRAGGFHGGGG